MKSWKKIGVCWHCWHFAKGHPNAPAPGEPYPLNARRVEVFVGHKGVALCDDHVMGPSYEARSAHAAQIAAAFAFGFAGKTTTEIVKIAWDTADALFLEGLRRHNWECLHGAVEQTIADPPAQE